MTVHLRSPKDLVEGCIAMLGGEEPKTRDDQVILMNCVTANIVSGVAEPAALVIKALWPERFGLLTDDEVTAIAAHQAAVPR